MFAIAGLVALFCAFSLSVGAAVARLLQVVQPAESFCSDVVVATSSVPVLMCLCIVLVLDWTQYLDEANYVCHAPVQDKFAASVALDYVVDLGVGYHVPSSVRRVVTDMVYAIVVVIDVALLGESFVLLVAVFVVWSLNVFSPVCYVLFVGTVLVSVLVYLVVVA